MGIYPAYVSKHHSNLEKHVSFLRIPNSEEWHYLAVKEISTLLRGIEPKHVGGTFRLNCLHSFRTSGKLESQKKNFS